MARQIMNVLMLRLLLIYRRVSDRW